MPKVWPGLAIEAGFQSMRNLLGASAPSTGLPPHIMQMYVRLVEECARMKTGDQTSRVPAQAQQGVAAAQSAAVSQAPESVAAAQSAAVSQSHPNDVVDLDATTTSPSDDFSAEAAAPTPKEEGEMDRK